MPQSGNVQVPIIESFDPQTGLIIVSSAANIISIVMSQDVVEVDPNTGVESINYIDKAFYTKASSNEDWSFYSGGVFSDEGGTGINIRVRGFEAEVPGIPVPGNQVSSGYSEPFAITEVASTTVASPENNVQSPPEPIEESEGTDQPEDPAE